MDEAIAQFTSITSASAERAAQYLGLTDNNIEQAIQLFFENDGADLGASLPSEQSRPTNPTRGTGTAADAIEIESDDDEPSVQARPATNTNTVEDDEAMARRLQEEIYGASGGGSGGNTSNDDYDEHGVRRPQARQAETLLGPGADWRDDPGEMNAAVAQQLFNRSQRRAMTYIRDVEAMQRAGIFNQQVPSSSIWNAAAEEDPETHRQNLSRATGGASEQSSKSNMLAEMYRPPFEIMSKQPTWEGVRADGKEEEKWIIVNVQDPNVFDCQVLNRDIWKDKHIQDTIRENFIFKQYTNSDPQASQYLRFYFPNNENQDAYPHIAIVDPRTGEQVKVWSGPPAPKAMDFLQQLHEFLDRYSLDATSRNPVATRRQEQKGKEVHAMSEEEMMEMAMRNSLGNAATGEGSRSHDPDSLTRAQPGTPQVAGTDTPVQEPEQEETSVFSSISDVNPHTEPDAAAPGTTRIQFRHPGGRVVRRFALDDPVRRIYEWLKADPFEDKIGVPFDLIFMGKNLIEVLDNTIEAAGLRNGSVMVEFGQD